MPALRQASMSSVPAGAVSFFPSTVKFTSGICSRSIAVLQKSFCCLYDGELRHAFFCEWAGVAVQVIFKLLAKLLDESDGRHRGCIAERAECAAEHVFREVLDVIDVGFGAEAGVETGERFF